MRLRVFSFWNLVLVSVKLQLLKQLECSSEVFMKREVVSKLLLNEQSKWNDLLVREITEVSIKEIQEIFNLDYFLLGMVASESMTNELHYPSEECYTY